MRTLSSLFAALIVLGASGCGVSSEGRVSIPKGKQPQTTLGSAIFTPAHVGTPPPRMSAAPLAETGTLGAWTTQNIPFTASTMLLLTDGRLMVQEENAPGWHLLTPDSHGAYATGTWSLAAPMSKGRLYYPSAVLKDGRVVVFGGEYTGSAGQTEDATGEIYDPVTNSWTALGPPPGWTQIGDAACAVLPDGRLLVGSIGSTATAIWNPQTNAWEAGQTKLSPSAEETWVLLPDGTVITVDCAPSRALHSELYVPGQGWVEGGQLPVALVDAASEEIGPGLLLPDGRAFFVGATGHTALFTPAAVAGQQGTWVAGPEMPADSTGVQSVAKDAPALLLQNGHVLVTGSSPGTSGWGGPTSFFELDPTVSPPTLTAVAAAPNRAQAPYEGRMMMLPSGEGVYSQGSAQLSFLTASSSGLPENTPVILGWPTQAADGSNFAVIGRLFNGVSQTVGYGDDASAATNYPLVRLVHGTSGVVTYARTHNHSTMGVATGLTQVSTEVSLPAGLAGGLYQMSVVANGVASAGVSIQIGTTSCGGCVDPNNVCQPGTTASACGAGGSICSACASNQSCVGHLCVTPCGGCRDGSSVCQPGTTTAACGAGGNACVACASGQTCVSGACQAVVCNGCVDGSSVCQPGTTSAACGAGGNACVACASGQGCLNQACTSNTFSLSASPAALTVAPGSTGTSTVSTAVTGGSAQGVSLSLSGLPSGVTGSFNPAGVTAGASSVLTLAVSASAAAGTYPLTLTGAGTVTSQTVTVTLTVPTVSTGGVTNGGFETGTLSGWTSTGTTSVLSPGHSGTWAAKVGGSAPTNGDSTLSQTFTIPSGMSTLSIAYRVICPDTLQYDWATITLKDNTAGTTSAVLSKTCTNTGAWASASAAVVAGHSVTLTLLSHDDNYASDPTYTLFDDVQLGGGTTTGGGVTNGGFESAFTGWKTSGAASISATSHSGTSAALLGSTAPTNGNSTATQTFTVPAGASTLSFWYESHCPDTLQYDWASATLTDNTAGTSTTVLAPVCATTLVWTQVSAAVVAGHSVTLTLTSHDDNYGADPTWSLFDDVSVQ